MCPFISIYKFSIFCFNLLARIYLQICLFCFACDSFSKEFSFVSILLLVFICMYSFFLFLLVLEQHYNIYQQILFTYILVSICKQACSVLFRLWFISQKFLIISILLFLLAHDVFLFVLVLQFPFIICLLCMSLTLKNLFAFCSLKARPILLFTKCLHLQSSFLSRKFQRESAWKIGAPSLGGQPKHGISRSCTVQYKTTIQTMSLLLQIIHCSQQVHPIIGLFQSIRDFSVLRFSSLVTWQNIRK